MVSAKFHHFGVPTSIKQDNESYMDGGKIHLTDPEAHPYRIEFLRFDDDSPMPEELQTMCHAAFVVDSLDKCIEGRQIILEPTEINETLKVAFIKEGDALIELMEMSE